VGVKVKEQKEEENVNFTSESLYCLMIRDPWLPAAPTDAGRWKTFFFEHTTYKELRTNTVVEAFYYTAIFWD
jgi:hypothetical protein